ncbi:MAG: chemotaxis protein CheW [Solirubrobacterales bacterium]
MDVEELLDVYLEDLRDNLLVFSDNLMKLQHGSQDAGTINNLFRVAHTIKGNSASMEFMRVEEVMHSLEDILQEVRDGKRTFTEAVLDVMFLCHDFLDDFISVVSRDHSDQAVVTTPILEKINLVKLAPPSNQNSAISCIIDEHTADDAMLEVVAAGIRQGYSAHEIIVHFNADSMMKSIRAWMVFERIDDHGVLVFSNPERPTEDQFRNPGYCFEGNELKLVVICHKPIDELVLALDLTDIQEVTYRQCATVNEVHELFERIRQEQALKNLVAELGVAALEEQITAPGIRTMIDYLAGITGLSHQVCPAVIRKTAAESAMILGDAAERRTRLNQYGREAVAGMVKVFSDYLETNDPVGHENQEEKLRDYLEQLRAGLIEEQKLGEILVQRGLLDETDVAEILHKQQTLHPDLKFGQVAAKEKKLPAYDVMQVLKEQEAAPEPKPEKNAGKVESGYVRVPVGKIDGLMDLMSELLILQSQLNESVEAIAAGNNTTTGLLSRTSNMMRSIQSLSMSLRMVEIRPTLHRLSRIARDTAHELNKHVSVTLEGEDTEIDRSAADRLFEPLMHLVRNAVSHGIESPEDRIAAGKSAEGKVVISCYSKRGSVYIEVADDGAGMDLSRILAKARALKMADEHREYTEEEILRFIFRPGFSTQEQINSISGRGVGMNVVEEEIRHAGGRIEIQNQPGNGCVFILRIPINLAVVNGTIVDVSGSRYIIPTLYIKEFFVAEPSHWVSMQGNDCAVRLRDSVIPVLWADRVFGIAGEERLNGAREMVIMEMEQKLLAFPVSRIVSRQEIVSKPLIQELSQISFASGAAILGDGTVSLILDVEALFAMNSAQAA